jgi:phospholipid-binding lipoprotein MlaA
MLLVFPTVSFADSDSDYESKRREQYEMSDPFEPFNRVMWDFNYNFMDAYIYRPVTENYVEYVPKPGRKAINNFVSNFDEPSTFVNNLLQFNFKYSAQALFRFSVNSTFGLLGFLDVADKLGVPRRKETFSNVLGTWSVPNGPYLMLPFIGPESTRELVGGVVDGLYFPFSYLSFGEEVGLEVFDGLDSRESLLGQEALLEQALDPYLFVKNAYTQYKAFTFSENNENLNFLESEQSDLFDEQSDEFDDFEDYLDEIN